uniref:site-specific DNA-methyltransferase (adenine-specific) n=1 Tax=viral metagenome TaxID=1070528 RepID=A0A6C0KPZ9_9ZZZZ
MANPKSYSCELCKKVFAQKCDYTRHKIKKAPCISLEEMEQIAKAKETSNDTKSHLTSVFKSCLNVLRDNEGITGEKALKNLSYLLILKLIEPYIGNEINIDDYEYDLASHFDESVIEVNKKRLLAISRFTKLADEKEENIPVIMKYLWDIILSVHPTTKNIFLKDKGFDIRHQSSYKKIIEKLYKLDLSSTDYDVLGNAYEEVFQDIMTGKVLGQYFTQPLVKKMMVKLINPQIKADGTIETCGDPTMGTGGFLISYLQVILQQSKVKAIEPNWDFIKTQGLYGKELDPDTYQLAVSNMLISSGHMFEQLENGDSIREPISRKFDNVLANPPFGIKGLKYDDFESSLKNEYIPIKSDNAVSLFIQAIIYMLKINGKAAVVLPDGQDLFSKTNKTLVAVREYLMKTCDLKEIIYLPSGIFTYTSIKTCVFYFVKKREGSDVLETLIKSSSKTQKENGRAYKFSKTHQTSKVAFYDFNPYEDVKNLLVEVPIEKIVNNSYSLNYAEYMKDESEVDKYEEDVLVKTLGEVCEFQNGYSFKSTNYEKQNATNIGILQIKSIQNGIIDENKITEYIEENNKYKSFEIQKGDILIALSGATTGKIGIYNLENKSYLNQRVGKINAKPGIYQKYIYYWYVCCNIDEKVLGLAQGTAQPNISTNDISKFKIPIPSLEKQKTIVAYLDYIYEKANKTSLTKIEELKQLNEFCLNNQKIFGENNVKELGEVCSIDYGTRIVRSNNIEGEYPVYGSGRAMFSTETFNRDGFNILIGRFALSLECVRFINQKIFLNDSGLSVKPKTEILLHKYIGYYLLHNQNIIYNCARGTAQKNLEMDELKSLKIPVPSLEKQKEIVAYCDYNCNLIKQLENEIENNKELAEQFIKGIVKNVGVDVDVDVDELEEEESEE